MLACVHHRLKRNKALADSDELKMVAVDGHEFFKSFKRCCPQCQQRTLTVDGEPVVQYYHQGVVCHLIGHQLAVPLDVELVRPGEGEETAAKRLLERVIANYPRYFDVICGDGLYFDAPFLNFCRRHNKHVLVVVKGDHRLLLQDARGIFQQMPPTHTWQDGRRRVRCWDSEGFTSAEGVEEPLRVVRTLETVLRRERVAGQWQEQEVESEWYWATTLSQGQLSARGVWRGGSVAGARAVGSLSRSGEGNNSGVRNNDGKGRRRESARRREKKAIASLKSTCCETPRPILLASISQFRQKNARSRTEPHRLAELLLAERNC